MCVAGLVPDGTGASQALAEHSVRTAAPLETRIDVVKLAQPEGGLEIRESQVRPDRAVDVRPAPFQVALIDVRGNPFEHGGISRDHGSALARRQDLWHAERKRADVPERSSGLIGTPGQGAGGILDEMQVSVGTRRSRSRCRPYIREKFAKHKARVRA
jgi:hypothetical protein